MEYLKVRNTKISAPLLTIIKDIKRSIFNGKLSVIKSPVNNNIRVTCVNPDHKGGHESKPSADIYIGDSTERVNYGTYSCFTCQTSCSFVHFVAMAFDQSDVWAEKWLIDNYADGTIEEEFINLPVIDLKKDTKPQFLNEAILNEFESFHPYMIQRKLTKRIIELFKVKYDPKTESIVFPIYDENDRLVMLTRRSVEGKRFIIDKNKQKPLYLYNFVKKNNIDKVIICEGQIDALTACAYGFPAIATIGAISDHQINLLNKSNIRILYLFFDNDGAGKKFKKTLLDKLRSDILLVDVDISKTNKKDINDLTESEFWNCIQESEDRF